jgi:hypothetical protein
MNKVSARFGEVKTGDSFFSAMPFYFSFGLFLSQKSPLNSYGF